MQTIIATKGYSIAEVSKIIGRHRNTVRNYIASGVLKAYESRRNIKEGQKALLVKGREIIAYINTY